MFVMKRTGIAELPLHYGSCPRWLFENMVKLARAITEVIVYEYSQDEFLKRLSDPYWFQGFSCALGFDWNSSGVTTTVCGALKMALNPEDFGIAICGGKGKTSRKTPEEIVKIGDIFSLSSKKIESLKYSSKLSAKVDNTGIQDGFNLYHHCIIFTEKGNWAVIQQGMNPETRYARRYHWFGKKIDSFVNEPNHAICCDVKGKVLNMVAKESEASRKACVDIANEDPQNILGEIRQLKKPFQKTLNEYSNIPVLKIPRRHHVVIKEDINERSLKLILLKTYEKQVEDFEELIGMKGVGPKTLRALALTADLIYGTEVSWRDPVKYSFSVGGKDGYPYKVKPRRMKKISSILIDAVEQARIERREKLYAIRRLNEFISTNY